MTIQLYQLPVEASCHLIDVIYSCSLKDLERRSLTELMSSVELPSSIMLLVSMEQKKFRPHYHIILFNAKLELIGEAWTKGHIHYGTVGAASVGYSLKYISKPSKIPLHKNDDRQKEKALMSKGLGANYLTENMIHWHRADLENRMYVNVSDTIKAGMPRYYKQRIYADYERKNIGFIALQKLKEREYEAAAQNPKFVWNKKQSAIAAELKRLKNSQQNFFV